MKVSGIKEPTFRTGRKGPVAPRTFRKYLEELILKGVIKAIGAKKGRAKVLVAVI